MSRTSSGRGQVSVNAVFASYSGIRVYPTGISSAPLDAVLRGVASLSSGY